MQYDGLFFISSAINAPAGMSIYSPEQRLEQMVKTLESVKEKMPNSEIWVYDSSPYVLTENQSSTMARYAKVLYTGSDPMINAFSLAGKKSVAEGISTAETIKYFIHGKSPEDTYRRIYKLSGRYWLNENFKPGLEHTNSYVFTKKHPSWLPIDIQNALGVYHLFNVRLWHMDYSLIDNYMETLSGIIYDSVTYGIDIEHSYYRNIASQHDVKHIEVDKIGVSGNIAPNGEEINE